MKKEIRLDEGKYDIEKSYLTVNRQGHIFLNLISTVKVERKEYKVRIKPLITIYNSGDYIEIEEDAKLPASK